MSVELKNVLRSGAYVYLRAYIDPEGDAEEVVWQGLVEYERAGEWVQRRELASTPEDALQAVLAGFSGGSRNEAKPKVRKIKRVQRP